MSGNQEKDTFIETQDSTEEQPHHVEEGNEVESLGVEKATQTPQDNKQQTSKKFLNCQIFQVSILFVTYAALYICYGALSVGATKMQEDPTSGITVTNISIIMLVTKISRFIPKLLSGSLVDIFGGKKMYVLGALIAATLIGLVGVGLGFYWVLCFWVTGQVATVVVWPAAVKITSKWIDYKHIGKVMGVLSQSYLIGDALARLYLTAFVEILSWRMLFLVAGCTMMFFVFGEILFVKDSPKEFGYQEPEANPDNLLGENGKDDKIKTSAQDIKETCLPIFTSVGFWLMAILNVLLSVNRYIMLDYVPLFMRNKAESSYTIAALSSTLFPLFGGAAAILMGFLIDKLNGVKKNLSIVVFEVVLIVCSAILWILTMVQDVNNIVISMILFSAIGFSVNGPYSLPSAALSVLFGGKKASATISALMDGFGMIGATLSGVFGSLFLHENLPRVGWDKMYLVNLVASVLLLPTTLLYTFLEWRRSKRQNYVRQMQ